MGAFYGSVHVRAADASTVIPHVEHVAKSKGAKFLVAPSIGGWVAVYPIDGGQDQRIGAALSKRIGGYVVWVSLHDDDVFAYAVWKDGKRLDEYNSCPDYFGNVSAAVRKRTAGNPAAFADLLPEGVTPDTMKRDLAGDDAAQLEAFARHLGLPNVLTSYDYLMSGETEDVAEFSRFVHVPDRTAELASRGRKEAAVAKEIEQLRRKGLLLCDIAIGEPKRHAPIPVMTSGSRGGEFLCAVADHVTREAQGDLFRLSPPYSIGTTPTGIHLKSTVHQLSVSPSGKYLAVGHAAGNWSTEWWDLSTQSILHVLPQSRAVDFVGFSANEAELLSLSEGVLTILSIRELTTRQLTCHRACRSVCLHPDDNIVVSSDGSRGIILVDAKSGNVIRRLLPPPPPKEEQDAAIAGMLAGMKDGGLSAEQLQAYENKLRATIAATHSLGGNDIVFRMRFALDGTRLVCAAASSLRVYDWGAIRSATDILPAPLFHVPAETFAHEFRRTRIVSTGPVYDAVDVPSKNLVLFAECSGVVRALNTSTGEVRALVRPPSPGPLWNVHLSADQRALALAYRPTYEDASDPTPYRIQIWDIERALSEPVDPREV